MQLNTGLTCSGPDEVLLNWNSKIPRLLVYGDKPVAKGNGIRWVQSKENPPIRSLFGTYMFQIPIAEACFLSNPDVVWAGDPNDLLAYVQAQRMEMTWAVGLQIKGKVEGFVMSSKVIAHIMGDIPPTLGFKDDWKPWMDSWMKRRMQQRYLDGSHFSLIAPFFPVQIPTPEPAPVMNAYDLPPEAPETPIALEKKPSKAKRRATATK